MLRRAPSPLATRPSASETRPSRRHLGPRPGADGQGQVRAQAQRQDLRQGQGRLTYKGNPKAVFTKVAKKGNYKLIAKYLGSTNFIRSKNVVKFTI